MITIQDKFSRKYRIQLKKKKNEISIYLIDGRKKYFISVVDIYKDTKTAEIQEFILKKWPDDYRNLGLGSIIAALLEEQLKKLGIFIIIGNIVETDTGAEMFWKKQGYEIIPCNEGPVRFMIKKKIT